MRENARVVGNTDGVPLYSEGTLEDITQRKTAEEALRQSLQQYRNLVDTSADMIWAVDVQGRCTFVSPAPLRLLGYTPQQMLGRLFTDFIISDSNQYEEDTQAFAQLMSTGKEDFQRETQYVRKDGTTAIVLTNSVALHDENGTTIGRTGTLTDVTGYRQAEIALRQTQERLLNQQKRETERVEVELARAQEQLVRQTRLVTIGQVSVTIAHELRNPLGAIRNAAYLLQRRPPKNGDGKDQQYLEVIEREVSSANQIMGDLLEMARGKPPHRDQVSVSDIVEKAYQDVAPSSAVELHTAFPTDRFTLWADAGQLRQVLNNLFTNAIQAMQGQGCISVTGKHENRR